MNKILSKWQLIINIYLLQLLQFPSSYDDKINLLHSYYLLCMYYFFYFFPFNIYFFFTLCFFWIRVGIRFHFMVYFEYILIELSTPALMPTPTLTPTTIINDRLHSVDDHGPFSVFQKLIGFNYNYVITWCFPVIFYLFFVYLS